MNKILNIFLLGIFALALLSAVGRADRIDPLKSYDNYIDTMLGFQYNVLHPTNQTKINVYGSLDFANWQNNNTNLNMRLNEASLGMCWRYSQNLTNELGYPDPNYLNQSLINGCKLSLSFLKWAQSTNGQFTESLPFHNESTGTNTIAANVFIASILVDIYNNSQNGIYLGNYSRLIKRDDSVASSTLGMFSNDAQKNITLYFPNEIITNATLIVSINKQNGAGGQTLDAKGLSPFLNYSINGGITNYSVNVGSVGSNVVNISIDLNISQLVYGNNLIHFWRNTNWNASDFINIRLTPNVNGTSYSRGGATNYTLNNNEQLISLNVTIDLNKTVFNLLKNASDYIHFENASLVDNTISGGAFVCLLTYNYTGVSKYRDCYLSYLNRLIERDQGNGGILSERNDITGSQYNYGCYSANYQTISLGFIAKINNRLGWTNLTNIINNASHFTYHQIVRDNNSYFMQGAYNCRVLGSLDLYRYNSTGDYDRSIEQHIHWSFFVNNIWADKFTNETTTRVKEVFTLPSGRIRGTYDLIEIYLNWKQASTNLDFPYNLNRYFQDFKGILNIKTMANYYISYGNTTPTGGVISDIYINQSNLHLFSANAPSTSNYGFGVLEEATGYKNAWDHNGTYVLESATYPYKVRFFGNMTRSTGGISDIVYNTSYIIHDRYLEVNHTVTSVVELQLWSVNNENLGNGSIVDSIPLVLNNATFLSDGFDFEYSDTPSSAAWGTVNEFNATGTNFHYYIGVQPDYQLSEYFTDIQGRRLALPLIVTTSSSSNKQINSSLSQSVTARIVVSVDDCTILGVYQSQTISPIFCSNGQAIFNLEDIPPGISSLDLSSNEELQLGSFCAVVTLGIPSFFTSIATIFSILAVMILLGFLFLAYTATNNKTESIDWSDLDGIKETFNIKAVMIAVLGVTLLGWLIIVIFGALCQI